MSPCPVVIAFQRPGHNNLNRMMKARMRIEGGKEDEEGKDEEGKDEEGKDEEGKDGEGKDYF